VVTQAKIFKKIFQFAIDKGLGIFYIIINPDYWRWMANAIGARKGLFYWAK